MRSFEIEAVSSGHSNVHADGCDIVSRVIVRVGERRVEFSSDDVRGLLAEAEAAGGAAPVTRSVARLLAHILPPE